MKIKPEYINHKLTRQEKLAIRKVTEFYRTQRDLVGEDLAYQQAMSLAKKGHGHLI